MVRGRFSSHVRQEIIETLQPATANRYASSAIVLVTFEVLVKASLFHFGVGFIFFGDFVASAGSMPEISLVALLESAAIASTPTTLRPTN